MLAQECLVNNLPGTATNLPQAVVDGIHHSSA
jgi:hypothetical protein